MERGGGYRAESNRQVLDGQAPCTETMADTTDLKRGKLQLGKLTVVNVAEVWMGTCSRRVWGAGVIMGPMSVMVA